MTTVFITGANGFVGKHLIRLLQDKDYRIIAGVFKGELEEFPEVISLPLDLTNSQAVSQAVEMYKPEWTFHLAALSSPAMSFSDNNLTLVNNIVAQANLLDALKQHAPFCRTLVIGSAEEYGKVTSNDLPINESCSLRPISPYAVSKITQDFMGLQYFLSYKLPVIRVRPFNHVGEGQSNQFVMAAFAEQIVRIERGLQPPVLKVGDLSTTRDFTDVTDMVKAYELALQMGEPGEVYNLGSGRETKIQDLVEMMISKARVEVKIEVDPAKIKPADIPRFIADSSKFNRLTQWEATTPLTQTVSRVLDYWRGTVSSI